MRLLRAALLALAVLCLHAAPASAASRRRPPPSPQRANSSSTSLGFDYLMLARQWPATFCELNTCTERTYNVFTIHGLWPNFSNGTFGPSDCAGPAYSRDALTSQMRGEMSCEWRSFKGPNDGFWAYEWGKHGTCALPLFKNQTAYFQAALALNNKFDLNEALVKAGINPQIANSLTPAQLTGVVQQAWGVTPLVTCSNGLISEVRTCFANNLTIITCPGRASCPAGAQDLPYGGPLPQVCSYYIQGIPPASDPSSRPPAKRPPPPPPKSPGSGADRPSTLSALAAAAAGAAVLLASL